MVGAIGGVHMWDRLLCAIDQFQSGQSTLDFVADLAAANDASVRVLHVRELSKMARVLPLETPSEAEERVRDGVLTLGRVGVAAEGRSCSALEDHVAKKIVEEARHWDCQAIVLGSRPLRGIGRLSGRGVRERILRASSLPVLVAPQTERDEVSWLPRLRSDRQHAAPASGR
jgi:nucleotide-binding universal stress UspA family protein